jgi:hypothetical protein
VVLVGSLDVLCAAIAASKVAICYRTSFTCSANCSILVQAMVVLLGYFLSKILLRGEGCVAVDVCHVTFFIKEGEVT